MDIIFQEDDYSVVEGREPVMVCVSLAGELARPVTLTLSTLPQTALEGEDFTPVSQTMETTAPSTCIAVSASQDELVEPQEMFAVQVSNTNSDPAINIQQATVAVLVTDSSTVSLEFASPTYAVSESDSVQVCVVLVGDTGRVLTANLQMDDLSEWISTECCIST